MNIENIAIKDIKPYERNANKHDERQIKNVKSMKKRIGKIPVKCDYCGKTFMRYAGNVKNTTKVHFCDRTCKNAYYKAEQVERECKNCGKKFRVYKSVLNDSNASGNYCSSKCYWESMKKDSLVYNGFKEAKKKYFSKPQVCAVCGTPKKIQIHHIIPNRLTQDQRKQNLIPLCPLHHNRIERMTAELHILFADDYDLELMLLNNILRTRQLETYCYLENLKNGQHQD